MGNLVDACVFVATAPGTGDFTVGAAAVGWRGPAAAGVVAGQPYHYRAFSADQAQWEIGTGSLTGSIFARTTVLDSSQGGGAKTNFATAPRVALTAFVTDFATTAQLVKIDQITITQPVNLDQVEADTETALLAALNAKGKTDYISINQPVNLDVLESDMVAVRAKTDYLTVTAPTNLDIMRQQVANSTPVTNQITVTQPVNLDTMEANIATNNAKVSFPEAPNDGKQYARKNVAWSEVSIPPGTYIGDVPPGSPVPGQLWWESDSGSTFIYYNDGNTSQWVQISAIGPTSPVAEAPNDGKGYLRQSQGWSEGLPTTGGTLTGDLTISKTTPMLTLTKTSINDPGRLIGQFGALKQWQITLGDTGSNLGISRFDDAGVVIDSPLYIVRATGLISLLKGQLQFPDTQNPSSDANTLDDYEEGSWTPTLSFGGVNTGITYSARTGYYVKVGTLVTVQSRITLSSKGVATGSALIDGLPFPIFGAFGAVGSIGYYGAFTGLTGAPMVLPQTQSLTLNQSGAANAPAITNANFTNASDMIYGASYRATT